MRQHIVKGAVLELPVNRSTTETDGSWVLPPYDPKNLRVVVEESSILRQSIEAYTSNIIGYGIAPAYFDESTEDGGQSTEWDTVQEMLDWLSVEKSLGDLFEEVLRDREETGNAFLEVIRGKDGKVIQLERVKPELVQMTKPEATAILASIRYKGQKKDVYRRFRKYKVDKYIFKQFGDPRMMDYQTGEETQDESKAARELLHLKIGNDHWGVPRWIGTLVAILGARKAELLNWRYFVQGRHTPAALLIQNGQLSPESEAAFREYAQTVGNESMQHSMLVLEFETANNSSQYKDDAKLAVELKSMADMLQNDGLFLEYDDKVREKVLSAFRLPPVYVGMSQDYNRSTVEEAKRIAEEQVFQAERAELEDLFNRHLLAEYELSDVYVEVKGPELSNDELTVNALDKLGTSLSTNEKRAVLSKMLGMELPVLSGEEHELPQAPSQPAQALQGTLQDVQGADVTKSLESVMKDVRESLDEVNDTLGAWKGETE